MIDGEENTIRINEYKGFCEWMSTNRGDTPICNVSVALGEYISARLLSIARRHAQRRWMVATGRGWGLN